MTSTTPANASDPPRDLVPFQTGQRGLATRAPTRAAAGVREGEGQSPQNVGRRKWPTDDRRERQPEREQRRPERRSLYSVDRTEDAPTPGPREDGGDNDAECHA